MADFVGAVDQGTTSTRFMIFDHDGRRGGRHQLEHEQILPRAGWVEHDPVEIWERTQTVIADRAGPGRPRPPPTSPRSASPTSARPPSCGTGAPAAPTTTRSSGRTPAPTRSPRRSTRDGRGDVIRHKAGLPPATYFSGRQDPVDPGERRRGARGGRARRRALRHHRHLAALEPHRRPRRRRARHRRHQRQPHHADGPRDPRLGRRAARRSSASRARCCPRSARAADATRSTAPRAAARSAGEVPITGVLGDQQAATVGQVCFAPGEAKNTYGTGNFLLLNTGDGARALAATGCSRRSAYQFGDAKPVYALEGSIAVTGSRGAVAARPARHHLRRRPRVEALARHRSTTTAGVYFVPAFSGLFAPYWRSDARGAIVGLSRFNTNAHLARATLEAICYQSRDVVDAMAADSGVDARRAQGRRRHHRQRAVHADPGRRARGAGEPPGGRRDDGAGRGLRRRAGRRVLVGHRRAARQLARGQALGARSGATTSAATGTPGGRRRSSARWTGSTSSRSRCERAGSAQRHVERVEDDAAQPVHGGLAIAVTVVRA